MTFTVSKPLPAYWPGSEIAEESEIMKNKKQALSPCILGQDWGSELGEQSREFVTANRFKKVKLCQELSSGGVNQERRRLLLET